MAKVIRKSSRTPTREQVQKCIARSWKSAQQIAKQLNTTTRTVQRRLNELRAAGVDVEAKTGWDGEYAHVPYYKVA